MPCFDHLKEEISTHAIHCLQLHIFLKVYGKKVTLKIQKLIFYNKLSSGFQCMQIICSPYITPMLHCFPMQILDYKVTKELKSDSVFFISLQKVSK